MYTTEHDLSFFDTQQIFTYKKISPDILPCTMDVVKRYYPYKPGYDRFSHYKIPNSSLATSFIGWLDSAGLTVKHAEIFYRPGTGAQNDAFIHVDGHRVVPGFAKINFIIGAASNTMKWWRPNAVTEKNNMSTPIGTKYLRFDPDECSLLDQVDMRGLYVVNAGIPHSVEMNNGSTEQPRICISVTPLYRATLRNAACMDVAERLLNTAPV